MGVLRQRKQNLNKHAFKTENVIRTRMMMRMADTPEVAITLAQLGMRLNRTGTMASAPWSNLFPTNVDM